MIESNRMLHIVNDMALQTWYTHRQISLQANLAFLVIYCFVFFTKELVLKCDDVDLKYRMLHVVNENGSSNLVHTLTD